MAPASEEMRDEPDPQQFTAEDLAGCTALLAAWLRRWGARAAAPRETESASGVHRKRVDPPPGVA